jgi:hypothetical protein
MQVADQVEEDIPQQRLLTLGGDTVSVNAEKTRQVVINGLSVHPSVAIFTKYYKVANKNCNRA